MSEPRGRSLLSSHAVREVRGLLLSVRGTAVA